MPDKKYYKKHKKQIIEYNNNWKLNNKDKVNKSRRKCYDKEKAKKYRDEYNKKHKKSIILYRKNYRIENKKYIRQYEKNRNKKCGKIMKNLKINGCSICGYNKNINALDFHHVNPKDKLFNIGVSSLQCKDYRIINEINKCILLCANCHREIGGVK